MAKITPEQHNTIATKIGFPTCQVCGNNHWSINDQIVAIPVAPFDLQTPMLDGSRLAAVLYECDQCGQVLFFNAHTVGLTQ